MATAILNNYGILESIVGFLDCKSMVQLSLGCKQLSSDVNKIALSILKSASIGFERRQDEERITVFEELNDHRIKLTISVTEFVQPYTTTVFEELNELRTRKRLENLLVTLLGPALKRDNIEYDFIRVSLSRLKSHCFDATIIIVSDDVERIGKYTLDRQQYIQNATFVKSTKDLGLLDLHGIAMTYQKYKSN